MTYTIVYSPEARDDLLQIYDYIVAHSAPPRALDYTERILACCEELSLFPERGMRYDDIRPGLRVTGFENRVSIAFHVTKNTVVIDRILYGGRDIDQAFENKN
ncbi:MAG: type II toxin-antitoxin system RelE/ParE family toxin [Pseudomonadota bacterium]